MSNQNMPKKPYLTAQPRPFRGTSLGLFTPTTFELQLLEIAVKGKRAYEASLDKEASTYGIDKQVMSLEILQEIKIWEKERNINLLVDRARNQVVKMKSHKNLHKRALLIYRDFLNISLSSARDSTETSSSQYRSHESTGLTSSLVRESREYDSSSQVYTLDEKFDEMLGIELPESQDEESSSLKEPCSGLFQGEPSGSSCEVISLLGDMSHDASIFEKPTETEEGVLAPAARFSELTLDDSEGGDSVLFLGNRERDNSCTKIRLRRMKPQKDIFSWKASDVKIDLYGDELPQILGEFPGKEFKHPIQWTLDGIIYNAQNIAELRRKHNIVLEGVFKKRWCHTWRNYFGFLLDTGVMLYFKKDDFRKFADFRKSTVSMPKGKQQRLSIQDVYVRSVSTNWELKFDSANHLITWCETIAEISKGLNDEVVKLQLPEELNIFI